MNWSRKKNAKVPTGEWLQWASDFAKHTPDYCTLQEKEFHHIFVADDMKAGFPNRHLLGPHSVRRSVAFSNDHFSFWKKNLGEKSFPVPILNVSPKNTVQFHPWAEQRGAPPARIKGELWLIRPRAFIDLDNHRLNTIQFYRKRIFVAVPFQDQEFLKERDPNSFSGRAITVTAEHIKGVWAWMYIGVPEYWGDQIDDLSFDPVRISTKIQRPWLNHYYDYELHPGLKLYPPQKG